MYKSLVWLVITLVVFGVCSCENSVSKAPSSKGVISVTDSSGSVVELDSVASKVVVLFDSSLDHIYMLGAQDKLVGIPASTYLQEDKFEFLSALDPAIAAKSIATPTFNGRSSNIEQILALNPDLVISYIGDTSSVEQLRDLGIQVYSVQTSNQTDMLQQIHDLGILLGKQERASQIINYLQAELDTLESYVTKDPKKVYYAWSKARILSTSGVGTLVDMVINLAGATNACTLTMESPNIGAELLYQWNPDLIILWDSSLKDVYDLKELESLPAVKNKQVFELSPTFYYDPHTVKFLLFAKKLHQWCYGQISDQELDLQIQKDIDFFYGINKN